MTGGYLVFVAWLTLTPQPIDANDQQYIHRVLDALHRRGYAETIDYDRLEFLANIAMFVPVGMFLLLLFGAGGWWLAGIGTFAMTVFIETVQTQIPGRVSDERDLFANAVGGLIGIAITLVLTLPATLRRRERKRYKREKYEYEYAQYERERAQYERDRAAAAARQSNNPGGTRRF